MTETVNQILTSLTLAIHIAIPGGVILLILFPAKTKEFLRTQISNRAIIFAFAISLVATSGSLFYSEIAGFLPCDLCWFQRIFMYPQTILLGLALVRKEETIIDYTLSLAAIGALISLYHNYLSFSAASSSTCSLSGVSCVHQYVLEFGYITIPVMSLTAFLSIILVLGLRRFAFKKTHLL